VAKKEYKRMSAKESIQIKRYLNVIYTAVDILQNEFIDKKISYIGEESTISIVFSASNFMHLCGIEYRRGTQLFFQDALDKKIKLEDINIKVDGTTFLKLQVLGSIDLLLDEKIAIVGQGIFSSLRYDAAIRTRRKILALSLMQEGSTYVPISLLNLTQKELGPGQKVICILSENLTSGEVTVIFENSVVAIDV
jgi:hypothetical protein